MLILRKIVFYIFAFFYVIFCPLVILYAFGYILKPQNENIMVETGIIYLSTAPPGASIYINGEVTENKTPAMLDKLLPGRYDIKLFLENYEVWNDVLPVRAGGATTSGRILLAPKKRKTETCLAGNFNDLVFLPGTQFLLAGGGGLLGDYTVYDCLNRDPKAVIAPGSRYAKCEIVSLFTARESPCILFSALGKDTKKLFLWVDLGEKEPVISDITDLFPEAPRRVIWEASGGDNIFTFREGSVNRLDIAAKALYPGFAQNARGLGVAEKLVYILSFNGDLSSMNYEKKGVNKLLGDKKLADLIFGSSGGFRIEPFSKDVILFTGEKGELLANRLPYKFVDKGTVGTEFDLPRERVLLWKKDKIGILDFSAEVTGAVAFEQGPRLDWIFTGGKNIKEAFFVYEASHVLFHDLNEVYLLDINHYGPRRLEHVLTVKEKTGIFYSEKTGFLYYLDPLSGNLASAEIVPGKTEGTEGK